MMTSVIRISCIFALFLCCCYVTKGASASGECRGTMTTPCSTRELYLPDFFCVFIGCCLHTTPAGKACYKTEKNVVKPTSTFVSTASTSALSNPPSSSTTSPSVLPETTTALHHHTETLRVVPPRLSSRGGEFNRINRPRPTPFKSKPITPPSLLQISLHENKNPPKKQSRPNSSPEAVVSLVHHSQEVTTTSVASKVVSATNTGSNHEEKLPGKNKSSYTRDEQLLLTNVEKEKLQKNVSGYLTTTGSPEAPYTIKIAMTTSRILTQKILFPRRSAATTTVPSTTTLATTTTPPATTKRTTTAVKTTSQQANPFPSFTIRPPSGRFIQESSNVPLFERNPSRTPPRSISQSPSQAPLPSSSPRQTFEEFIAILLLEQLKRQQESKLPPPPPVCELDDKDACCRADPTAPCCEFQELRDFANRAAPTTRIVGGTMAGSLRSSVAHLSKLPYRNHFCGGTLINNRWVLTAAHCALEYCHGLRPHSEILVSLGKYRKGPFLRDPGQQDITVRDVVCHHNQCKAGRSLPRLNDVALLRLMWPARFSSTIFPALMPQQYEYPTPNRNCVVLGFGKTRGTGYGNVMKQVTVPLISNEQCNLPNWRDCSVRACMMCAGGLNSDPCDGDSGGPLFCTRANGLYVLHGVYSWGRCGVEERKPAVYTRASYFVDWVSRVTQTFAGSKGTNRIF